MATWDDLPLPVDYPEPHMEDREKLSGEAAVGGEASGTREESTKDQGAKCSPNLLEMLKAAESRCAAQGQGRDGAEASETGEMVTEALKTDMVSKQRH